MFKNACLRRRPDSKAVSEQKAGFKAQLNRAYDALRLKRQEQQNMLEDIASDEAHLENLHAEAEKLHGLVESLLQRKVCLMSCCQQVLYWT